MSVRLLARPAGAGQQPTGQQDPLPLPLPDAASTSASASAVGIAISPARRGPPKPSPDAKPPPLSSPPQSPSSAFAVRDGRPFSSPPPPPPPPSAPAAVPLSSSSTPSASKNYTQSSGSTGPTTSGSTSSAETIGVVVVGVIGRVEREVSGLFDRLLDSHVFRARHLPRSRDEASPSADRVCRERMRSRAERRDCESKESGPREGEVVSERFESAGNDAGTERGTRGEKWRHPEGGFSSWRPEGKGRTDEKTQIANEEDPIPQWAQTSRNQTLGDGRRGEDGPACDGRTDASGRIPLLLRKLKYYHEEEKGMVYVQFTWGDSPLEHLDLENAAAGEFSARLEQREADNLRGLLLMFSVCHVILMVQEGVDFDPHMLRMLRLLHAAKQYLVPFVKAQLLPGLLPAPASVNRSFIKSASPGGGHLSGRAAIMGRTSSTIALMSGSTPFLVPGQCIPTVLFVCLEDLGESAVGISPRPTTGFNDVPQSPVASFLKLGSVLSDPDFLSQPIFLEPVSSGAKALRTIKTQGGQRKRLQATMETQIRFWFKKCRTVAGVGEVGPPGGGGALGTAPRGQGNIVSTFQGANGNVALFVLDPSKAVVVLDKSVIWLPDFLDHAVNGTEAQLVGELGLGDLLGDSMSNANIFGDDAHAVKDFLFRQAEILRGKGGISATGAGSASGVGMVAAAAAAAAASAASGGLGTSKAIGNPPELPTFPNWLSACQGLAESLSAQAAEGSELNSMNVPSIETSTTATRGMIGPKTSARGSGKATRLKDSMDSVLLALDSGFNVDVRFSATWCKKVLATAQKAYLKGLPLSYSSSCHELQLKRTLKRFQAIVRGPAVSFYTERLRNDCDKVWQSGRQLCDAESLTGNPCIHLVHEVEDANVTKDDCASPGKADGEENRPMPHSSGVVFLHACACGRSRKLRKDPFDFKNANVSFFKFSSCEDLLPSLTPPIQSDQMAAKDTPWSLVCLGNSAYYQPAMGLVQTGLCSKQNFLSFWDIPVSHSTVKGLDNTFVGSPGNRVTDSISCLKESATLRSQSEPMPFLPSAQPLFNRRPVRDRLWGSVFQRGCSHVVGSISTEGNSSWSHACGPVQVAKTLRQRDSALPLHAHGLNELTKLCYNSETHSSLLSFIAHKDNTYSASRSIFPEMNHEKSEPAMTEDVLARTSPANRAPNGRFRNNHARVYIGFEHECPNGHRFLVSRIAPSDPISSDRSLVTEEGKRQKGDSIWPSKQPRTDSHVKMTSITPGGASPIQENSTEEALDPFPILHSKLAQESMEIAPSAVQNRSSQEGLGEGLALLNSDIPIYMRCPHCKSPEGKEGSKKSVGHRGHLSQLQRIFMVTPSLPLLLASRPTVEFKDTSMPGKTVMEFNRGNEVVLPPDSFLSLRLPFVYYSERDGVPHRPLVVSQNQPEQCAWLVRNTAIYLLSGRGS